MTGGINSDEPEVIHIMMVDDRASFKRSEDHPKWIFLSTVLRWAAKGCYNSEEYDHVQVRKSLSPEMLDELKRLNEAQRLAHPTFSPEQLDEIEKLSYRGHCVTAQIRSNNSSAMASVGSLLADGIELGDVPVLNIHSWLSIGSAEKEVLVSRLRRMDVNGNTTGQAEIDNEDYLLGGKELCLFIDAKVAPVDIDRKKVGLLHHLEREGLGNSLTHAENQKERPEDGATLEKETGSNINKIPGRLPPTAAGKLAIKAAWQIKCESKRLASAKEVMARLQEWADAGKEPDVLVKSLPEKRAVKWATTKSKHVDYTLEACGRTLEKWKKRALHGFPTAEIRA